MNFIIPIHQNLIMGLQFYKEKQLLPLIKSGCAYVKKINTVRNRACSKKKKKVCVYQKPGAISLL